MLSRLAQSVPPLAAHQLDTVAERWNKAADAQTRDVWVGQETQVATHLGPRLIPLALVTQPDGRPMLGVPVGEGFLIDALFRAARAGDVAQVQDLLAKGPLSLHTHRDGCTLVREAAIHDHGALVAALLARDPSLWRQAVVHHEANAGMAVVAVLLATAKRSPALAPAMLIEAASQGSRSLALGLMDGLHCQPAKRVNKRTAIEAAACGGHVDMARELLQRVKCINPKPYFLRSLLHATYPVVQAVEHGHLGVVAVLQEYGATLPAHAHIMHNGSLTHTTSLMALAAQHGDAAMVDALVVAGCCVNDGGYADSGDTKTPSASPLSRALTAGHWAAAARLLAHGANIDRITTDAATLPPCLRPSVFAVRKAVASRTKSRLLWRQALTPRQSTAQAEDADATIRAQHAPLVAAIASLI